MALNLEQASDIIERMGSEIADKSLAARRAFSEEGLKELDALYDQLLSNLQLAMSVFFSGDVTSARRLRRSKHRFRILNRRYSHAHVDRLHQQNVQSIETSSLHLGLLGDMKRLNSLFCSVAYSVLEQPDQDEQGRVLSEMPNGGAYGEHARRPAIRHSMWPGIKSDDPLPAPRPLRPL